MYLNDIFFNFNFNINILKQKKNNFFKNMI
jgi:hypothetical protein